ncbi:MAG: hypothetical protein PF448_00080 [Bacteroidales bacterium]|jgi:FtsZ-binding cell division protein ZapB|nr:hypothetical protein [Bacteroidales bacterium]
MNSGYQEIVESIKAKTARLHSVYQHHKKLNYELTNENEKIKSENTELKAQINRLISEMETLKLTSTLNRKEGRIKQEAEGQINNLIREVDQCITLINRM